MMPRLCLYIAITSAIVLAGALLLPVDAAPRPDCARGSIANILTDCRVR